MPPKSSERQAGERQLTVGPNDILRFLLELFAFFSLGLWGYLTWPFPWPGLLFMFGTPVFAIVAWGLFRSPKARFPLDSVGRGLVEIAIMGSAVLAWATLGYPLVALAFGIIALISGVINLRKEIKQEASR